MVDNQKEQRRKRKRKSQRQRVSNQTKREGFGVSGPVFCGATSLMLSEVWTATRMEQCKGKRMMCFCGRSGMHLPWDPVKIRSREGSEQVVRPPPCFEPLVPVLGVFFWRCSNRASHISVIVELFLVGLIYQVLPCFCVLV